MRWLFLSGPHPTVGHVPAVGFLSPTVDPAWEDMNLVRRIQVITLAGSSPQGRFAEYGRVAEMHDVSRPVTNNKLNPPKQQLNSGSLEE